MTYTEKDFLEWLKSNREHFLQGYSQDPQAPEPYTSDEVADRAIVAGFDRTLVYRMLSHFQDALNDTSIDRRSDMNTLIFVMTVKDVAQMKEDLAKPKPFDTAYLWKNAVGYLVTGEDAA